MQPQEQQPIPAQPVYYVPVQPAPAPAPAPLPAEAERPEWARVLSDRTSGHSAALALIALVAIANLILTFVLWNTLNHALHPFG